ncbi:MAG TPA: nucleotide exchange factor GrpE [Acidimicrobiales bacterium]|nr:nucleotide exchange factor GrpE [Acidimicrobiales bacterium]
MPERDRGGDADPWSRIETDPEPSAAEAAWAAAAEVPGSIDEGQWDGDVPARDDTARGEGAPDLAQRNGASQREGGESGEGDAERHDDEMDAFFPSVARAAATGEDIASILDEELLVKALAERDEYLDALRRLQADFENFRKRTERQLDEVRSRASESLLERLLPVVDAFDYALAHLSEGSGEHEALTALVQVGGLLRDTLAKEGLERIDAVGVAFDPTVHDAVAHEAPAEGGGAGGGGGGAVVDEVLRAGYLLKGRVLRPAMVKVRG